MEMEAASKEAFVFESGAIAMIMIVEEFNVLPGAMMA